MSVTDLYSKLFNRIRQIRLDEFGVIQSRLGSPKFNRALEIGCGDGTQSLLLARICSELIATDTDLRDIPQEYFKKISFQTADAQYLPFPDNHFDLIFSSNVLEHIDNLEMALIEMKRVLSNDGIMIHVVPNAVWKFLQIGLWIPFRLKVVTAKLFEEKISTDSVDEFGHQKTSKQQIISRWFPPIHGNTDTHLKEFLSFRVVIWENIFVKTGMEIDQSFGVRLYSAWNMGPSWLRDFLDNTGLKSSHCFFLKKRLK